MIVVFAGRAESGKSMCSEHLVKKHGFLKVSFATALKELTCELLKIESLEKLNELKSVEYTYVLPFDSAMLISKTTDINYTLVREWLDSIEWRFHSVREALQLLGTDLIRKYNPDWHVEKLKNTISQNPTANYVIDDARFPNEVYALQQLDATIFFLIRPSVKRFTNHPSESSLCWQMFDNVLINNVPMEHLFFELDEFIVNKKRLFDYRVIPWRELYEQNPLSIEDSKMFNYATQKINTASD